MKYRILLTFLLGLSLNLTPPLLPEAQANNREQQSLAVTSADQAASMAAGRFQGTVLKVSRSQINGGPGYRVKMISIDGKVFNVAVDARTGRVWRD